MCRNKLLLPTKRSAEEKLRVDCKFKLEGNVLSFDLGKYDESKVLVIDPTLIFSTYSGSTAANFGYTATFDSEGFLYSGSTVFGLTGTYPTDTGAFQTSFGGGTGTSAPPFGLGGTDVAITKWDTTGSSFVYSTYLGGNEDELPHSLVVNSRDELYILGTTGSSNFPVDSLGYDTSFAGGPSYTPAGWRNWNSLWKRLRHIREQAQHSGKHAARLDLFGWNRQ